MKRVYFVRHGVTVFNEANLVQDETDTLSPVGMVQAKRIAERLATVPFTTLMSSDYIRAKATAEVIAGVTKKTPEINPLLRETLRPTKFIGTPRDGIEYLSYLQQSFEYMTDPSWRYSDEDCEHQGAG